MRISIAQFIFVILSVSTTLFTQAQAKKSNSTSHPGDAPTTANAKNKSEAQGPASALCPHYGISSPNNQKLKLLGAGNTGYADWKKPWNDMDSFTQPVGKFVAVGNRQYVQGKGSVFGGQGDSGIDSDEKAAYSGRNLKNATGYFCAIRMNHGANSEFKNAAQGTKILVRNPDTGLAVVCKLEDWGPNPKKGDAKEVLIDLSPRAMKYLVKAAKIDDRYSDSYRPPNLQIAFAKSNSAPGPVSGCF